MRRLGDGGSFLRMVVRDVTGIEWGMFTLLGGAEKAQRYTGQHYYISFVVNGRARLTLNDQYRVPFTDIPMAQGFSAEVLRGDYYSIQNADAMAPVNFLFYKAKGILRA